MKPRSDKVRHVQRAGQTRNHTCHWVGCTKQVPPAMWGCTRHWYALPGAIRAKIWRCYEVGQEIAGTPSAEYVAVAREAEAWIIANHGPKPKTGDLFG